MIGKPLSVCVPSSIFRSGDFECFQWDPGGCSCACHVLCEEEGFPVCSAFVLSYFSAAAACSCVSSTAAAGNIDANAGMFALVGQVLLSRPLALVEIYFYSGILVSAAALVKSHAQRKASLAAAAFVLVFFGAAAANCCVSRTAAVCMTSGAYGLVLGLRVLCACTTAMVVHARDMLGFQDFVFALDGLIALESDRMDRQVLAGSLFSGTGEQASGRVDVPGKDIQQQAAAASMVSGLCLEAMKGVQICQPTRNPLLRQSHQIALSWFAPCRDVHWFARSLLDLLWMIWNAAFRNTQQFRALLSS